MNFKNQICLRNKEKTVAVISNGSAILGLGDLGALYVKGKAVLFKDSQILIY